MTDLVIGIDLGTSGVKALAVDRSGKTVLEANRSYPLLTPQPGWTEQRPQDWWDGVQGVLSELSSGLSTEYEVVCISFSGQMHGMVPLDSSGEVIRPALLWNDQRTGDAVSWLESKVPRQTFIERGGNPPITGFQLPKLVWLRDAEPENYARVRHILFPKDYIAYKLTGQMHAEPSDASGSNCFHLESKTWDSEILGTLEIPLKFFPEIVASDARVGTLLPDVAHTLGLPAGIPVVAGAGDNAAAATGLGISSANPVLGSLSLGSSGVIFAPLKEATPDPQGRVHLFCHADGAYHLLGVTLSAAASLQWLRNTLFPSASYDELTRLAASSAPGSSGVRFKPYLAGERTPHMNPRLRGSFEGLSLATGPQDMVRAVLEGVAMSLRDALDVIQPLQKLEACVVTGGGSTSEFWLQIVSDALELPLLKPAAEQGAAYGAALLALRHVGGARADLGRTPEILSEIRPQSSLREIMESVAVV